MGLRCSAIAPQIPTRGAAALVGRAIWNRRKPNSLLLVFNAAEAFCQFAINRFQLVASVAQIFFNAVANPGEP